VGSQLDHTKRQRWVVCGSSAQGKGSQPKGYVLDEHDRQQGEDLFSALFERREQCLWWKGKGRKAYLDEHDRQQGEDTVLSFDLGVLLYYLAILLLRLQLNRRE